MRATALNHVSISLRDSRSRTLLRGGLRPGAPADAHVRYPVDWFGLGDGQLHLFQRGEDEAPQYHHFGVEVDDFEAFYLRLTELGIRDAASLGEIRELPSGEVQMYLRDPGGNLVEIDWPDARTLERQIVTRPRAGSRTTSRRLRAPNKRPSSPVAQGEPAKAVTGGVHRPGTVAEPSGTRFEARVTRLKAPSATVTFGRIQW